MEVKQGMEFKMSQKIGKGAYGEIFQALLVNSNSQVAVKIEPIQCKSPQLFLEAKYYQHMHKDKTAKQNIPEVYYCSQELNNRILIMQLLGPTLENLFEACDRKFSLKTVLKIVLQCLQRIEFVHSHNLIHRDIKPHNFLVGLADKTDKIYLIDFGLAKHFFHKGEHISEKLGITGTCRYASLSAHSGNQQSRKDDLESLGFMLIYLLKSILPWQGFQSENKEEKYDKVLEKKRSTSLEQLCEGFLNLLLGCPQEFLDYLTIVRNLRFDEKPDYTQLKKIFMDLFEKNKFKMTDQFDWEQLAITDTI